MLSTIMHPGLSINFLSRRRFTNVSAIDNLDRFDQVFYQWCVPEAPEEISIYDISMVRCQKSFLVGVFLKSLA